MPSYLEILACVLPLLQGATIGGALGHPGPTDVRVHGTSDKPTSTDRIVYSLKIAEAGSEPSSTIFITRWSLCERWKTGDASMFVKVLEPEVRLETGRRGSGRPHGRCIA